MVGVVGGVASMLSGDTPQPIKHAYDGLNLYVGADHKQAWFTKDAGAGFTFGPLQVLPHEEALNVPVHVEGGGVSFDAGALQRAYGRPLPTDLVNEARPDVSERVSPTGSPALSTASGAARAVAQNPRQLQNWQAHHLIPFNVANDPAFAPAFLKAAEAGWKLDSRENVIALPGDRAAYLGPPNDGVLPEHSGSHPVYDRQVRSLLAATLPVNGTPGQVKNAIESVEYEMQDRVAALRFNPKVK